MLRSLILISFAACANAAVLPDQMGAFRKGPAAAVAAPDPALYAEYGLDAVEQADFISEDRRFTITAWKLKDSTGALGLYDVLRPADAKPSTVAKLAGATADGVTFAYGNYVFQIKGSVPGPGELEELFTHLHDLDQAPLPTLAFDLPEENLIPNSERYILGPEALQRFEPRIPPSVAAFHLGAEAQFGKYRTRKGTMAVLIFSYPTPNIARERLIELQKIAGAVAKRSGPLVAVTIDPANADDAERVLAKVQYRAVLTLNQKIPTNETQTFAKLILNIFVLAGVLIGICLIAGVGFGGFRVLARKMGKPVGDEGIIELHLTDKPEAAPATNK